MAEGFARAGVPVFAADIKGDLSGISEVGEAKDFIVKRASDMELSFHPDQFRRFLGCFRRAGASGARHGFGDGFRCCFSRMMDLNDVQEGVMNIAFRVADEQGLLLLDMKDLRAILSFVAEHAAELTTQYGNVSKQDRGNHPASASGAGKSGRRQFFWRTGADAEGFMRTDSDGRGMINILVADKLMQSPRLYATFLLWMLSELFEELPEAGDPPKPKLVFFFDEAHLLFDDAPKALMDKVQQSYG